LGWDIIFIVNRFNGADWLAGATVNALIWLDIKHPLALVDAINRALLDTGFVLHIDTRKGDHIGHLRLLSINRASIVHNLRI
jgi:hypothetical protein